MTSRRSLLAGSLAGWVAPGLMSGAAASGTVSLVPKIVPLWPDAPPGGARVTVAERAVPRSSAASEENFHFYGVRRPTLGLLHPARSNGHALLLIPGGSYERVAGAPGGGALARTLAGRGYLVGSLIYRLPYDGWEAAADAPLQDAQRAIRLLIAEAGTATKVGVIGFSAGGHIAGRLATSFAEPTYAAVDAADSAVPRPSFAGLFFPVITMAAPHAHGASRRNLLGSAPSDEAIDRWSVERHVSPATPPTFVTAAADDRTVPAENSLMLFSALRAAKVPSALHIFDRGGHGFGRPGDQSGPGRFWPDLFDDWLSGQKLDPSGTRANNIGTF